MASPATRSGDVLNEVYELRELLRSEGSLEIYRATDRRSRTDVHVKVLRPEFALQGKVVETFLRGPRALSGLTHPSLPFVRLDTDDIGIPFVVEETVDGRALSALTDSFPQGLPLAMVAQLCLPLVEALALAHRRGLTHGAIDEEHVKVLGPPDAPLPKLIGLGVSQAERGAQDAGYRAPEHSAGLARGTPQADVYALGVLLYKMLSGALPFRSGKKSAVPLDEIAPHLPAPWVALTGACLHASKVERVQDAGALLAQLRACTAPQAKPTPAIEVQARATPVPAPAKTVESRPAARDSARAREAKRNEPPAPGFEPTVAAPAAMPVHVMPLAHTEAAPLAVEAQPAAPPEAQFAAAVPEPLPQPARELDKKQTAKDMAEKLSAKSKPQKSAKDIEPARSAGAMPPKEAHKTPPPPAKIESTIKSETPVVNRPSAERSPAQAEAFALSVAQLEALRALRVKEEEDDDRDRFIGLFFMLLFVALLLYGTPLLTEPDFETARATFGPKLRVAASTFAAFAMIGTVRVWIARSRGSLIARVRSFVLQIVAASILLVTLTLYDDAPALGLAAGFARRFLPWGSGLVFFFFGFEYAQRGLRQLGTQIMYGAFALAIASGSMFGSYRNLIAGVKNEKKRAAALLSKRTADGEKPGPTDTTRDIKRQLANSIAADRQQGGDVSTMKQRKEVGASEEQDMMPAQELEANRAKNQKTLEQLRDKLPAVGEEPQQGR